MALFQIIRWQGVHQMKTLSFVNIFSVSARISKGQGTVSAKKGNLRRSMEKR
jgi:hypothetical protein